MRDRHRHQRRRRWQRNFQNSNKTSEMRSWKKNVFSVRIAAPGPINKDIHKFSVCKIRIGLWLVACVCLCVHEKDRKK